MPLTFAALRAELQNDPGGLGYAALDDDAASDCLNLVRDSSAYAVWRGIIDGREVMSAINRSKTTSVVRSSE